MGIWSVIYTDMWSLVATDIITTSSTDWDDMPGTSMDIETYLPTDLVIMFSTECGLEGGNGRISMRCLVDGEPANSGSVVFIQNLYGMHSHAFNFYMEKLPRGNHEIRMQWKVEELPSGAIGNVADRTLNVIANGAGHL